MATAIERPFARSLVIARRDPARFAGLTRRQRQVLDCRCVGRLSAPQTADALGIAVSTVTNHVIALLARVGARSMVDACYDYALSRTDRRG